MRNSCWLRQYSVVVASELVGDLPVVFGGIGVYKLSQRFALRI